MAMIDPQLRFEKDSRAVEYATYWVIAQHIVILVACLIAFSVSFGDAQLGAQSGTVIAALFVVAKTIVELRTV